MSERVLRGPVFYAGEPMLPGTMVRIERAGENGERQTIQVHYLVETEEYRSKRTDRCVTILHWESTCTECGDEIGYKARNATKYLKRRCPICNEENPYDPRGWSMRPRNRYVRVDPEPEADEIDPASLF